MRAGDFSSGLAQLHGAIEGLERSWGETREQWDDDSSRKLHAIHVLPVLQQMDEVLQATVRIGEVIAHMRRDCEP